MKRGTAWILALLLLGLTAAAGRAEAMLARVSLSGLSEAALGNAALAARAVNGYYLPQGSRFSFNDATGPRTEANGYGEAEDDGGEWMPGGGACRVATAIYRALSAGGANVEYDSLSFSADGSVRVNDAEGLDFSFYNYGGDLCVELYRDGDALGCAITAAQATESAFATGSRLVGSVRLSVPGAEALRSNIALACGSVNDTALGPGDTFSFNAVVGPRSPEYGYLLAPDGQGADVVGGGVDAVASAVYLCVKGLDSVAVTEKATYGSRFNQGYVSSPQNAIRVDAAAGQDFAFEYDGGSTLSIYAWPEGGCVVCEVYETGSW